MKLKAQRKKRKLKYLKAKSIYSEMAMKDRSAYNSFIRACRKYESKLNAVK